MFSSTALLRAAFLGLLTVAAPLSAAAEDNTPTKITYREMPAGLYKLDVTHASVVWKVSHLGLSQYTARFTEFDSDLTFDPKQPENSKVTASINPTSIRTDYPFADKKDFDAKLIEDPNWFNALAFPKITFASSQIRQADDDSFVMLGDLTFLGVTKPVELDVTLNGVMARQPFSKKPTMGFSASGTLKRSDWGMTIYVPNIGDEVTLLIEAEFGLAD